LLLVGAGLAPASAKEKPVAQSSETTVKMEYLGFDAKVAKKNGYDIRTDKRGVKYSIPETEPKDSMNGAVYMPKDVPAPAPGMVSALNTVSGNCGTATLTGYGKNFYTAYAITNPWIGGPFSHTWRVAVSSAWGYKVFNLDGLAPAWSNNWSTTRSISFIGIPYNGWVSNGTVTTRLGFICGSMNPGDKWYSQ
jgi:hypothetical protein